MSTYSTTILSDLPVAYWRLGEISGTSAADASGNGRTGTYGGGVVLGMAGAIRGENDAAARFGSGGAKVVAPLLPLMSQWTAEAWVYPTAAQSGTPYIVCDRFSLSGINFGIVVNLSAGTCAVSTLYDNGSLINTPQVELTLNAWTHVAGTYDGSNLRLYLNGALSQTLASTTASASGGVATDIGIRNSPGDSFIGSIDEVAIYNTALSASRLLAHYNAAFTATGATAQPLGSQLIQRRAQ